MLHGFRTLKSNPTTSTGKPTAYIDTNRYCCKGCQMVSEKIPRYDD